MARTNNSEKHGKQNEKGEAQKKQQQHAKDNGSNGRSEQGRMWRENDKTKDRRTTKRTKRWQVTKTKQKNVEE